MNRISSRLASPLWLLLAASCGSPAGGGAPPDAAPGLPELGACADKWQLIMDAQPFFTPRALRWREGVLYFSGGKAAGIQSVAATGGSPAVLVTDQVWS